jgi:hypothetical protein
MAELKDIDVERIDGVEEPASKKKFLILKSEEPDELRANAEEFLNKVASVLEKLAKADISLDEEIAEALDELAKELGLEISFAEKVRPAEEYGYPQPEEKSEVDEELVSKIGELLDQKLGDLLNALKSPQLSSVAKSRQPMEQDAVRPKRLGEGLFDNIIFNS